ncbi:hypothetical protein XMD509_000511 [Marinobacterium sp. xm-d-509]|nr:hypothetical protein [Marinobacterium sp. xm-g-48]NRP82264.1 hypothetical protein [Marinobacterium sp. xm-d-509]
MHLSVKIKDLVRVGKATLSLLNSFEYKYFIESLVALFTLKNFLYQI